MVSLMELLPLLKGWEHRFDFRQNEVIDPGKELRITWEKPGWVRYIAGTCNNPYTVIEHNVYANKPMSLSYYQLFAMGKISPSPAGTIWLQKYDVANNFYMTSYEPVPPQEFTPKPRTYVTQIAPDTDPITGDPITTPTTMSVIYDIVLITNERDFRESLQEVGIDYSRLRRLK